MPLAYPFAVARSGRSATLDGAADMRALIEQVLFTAPGERVNRPDFGAGVHQLVFGPASEQMATAAQHMVQAALVQWLGDVIQVEEVTVRADDATLTIEVGWRTRLDGARERAVYTREM